MRNFILSAACGENNLATKLHLNKIDIGNVADK